MNPLDKTNKQPKPTFEKVFDRLRMAAEDAMRDCPELRAVAVVTDWSVGATEFPYGLMIGRNGPVRHPNELLGVSGQTVKMLYRQCELITELLGTAENMADQIAEEITKREQRLKELDDLIAARSGQVADAERPTA
jgi:hypothetical protein